MSAGLASKRRYLGGILKYYLLFGVAVFAALLLNFMVNNGAGGTAHMISMVATLAITFFYVWGLTGLNRTLRRLNQYERQTGIHDEI